jgi:hypothetical protein
MAASPRVGLEQLAQLRDVDLDHVWSACRRLLAPEVIDKLVDRDDLMRVKEEVGEKSTGFAPPTGRSSPARRSSSGPRTRNSSV